MKEKLPINRDVLVWARTSIGLSVEEVSSKLGKPKSFVENWENGIDSPTFSQLERLAFEIYKRPLAVFFFPERPKEETPKTEFRTLPDTIINELPPEIIKIYRKAKLYQIYLDELFEGRKPTEELFLEKFSITNMTSIISISQEIRRELKISIDEQSKWNSTEKAFKRWRSAFEEKGVFIFKDAFKNDDYSGFCLYDENFPVIIVNNSMPDSRQIFTLFHELAHLLFKSGGVDFRSSSYIKSFRDNFHNIEVTCNRFANEFLVPRSIFDTFDLIISEAQFQKLANYFSVSREVILRNYLELGLITQSYYEEFANRWIKQAQEKKAGGGSYYYNQKAYLGDRYISIVYGKYYQNKISLDNVAEYLNVKAKNLPVFEHIAMESGRNK